MTRTAVIAGVGPGLGESLARKFAAEGCRVALFARSLDYIEELADDLPDPGKGLAIQTDLADVDQIRDGFESVREAFGPVDVLVNHASAASWKRCVTTGRGCRPWRHECSRRRVSPQ